MAKITLRQYKTPEETLRVLIKQLNHILNNLNTDENVVVDVDNVKASMIDFGTGANQVDATLIPINDVGGYFPTDTVESALQFLGLGTYLNVIEKTSNCTLSTSDRGVIKCDGTFTVTLPSAVEGLTYHIVNIGTGTVTIDGDGGEIQGDETFDIYEDECLVIVSDGTNWVVI